MVNPKTALKYVNENRQELDMMIGFQHMEADCIIIPWVHKRFDLVKLKNVYYNWQNKLYHRAWNANYLESHDQPRVISRYGSEKLHDESGKALAIMYSFLSGSQFVYQGQEIGMTSLHYDNAPEGTDPWAQFKDISTFCVRDLMRKFGFKDSKILKTAHTAARDNARTPVQWTGGKNAGFCDVEPWYTVNPNYVDINVEKQEADPNSLLNFYRKVIALRKKYADAVIYGKFDMYLKNDRQLFVYDKTSEDDKQKLRIIINMSDKPVSRKRVAALIPENAHEILSVYEGELENELKPYEARVYLLHK